MASNNSTYGNKRLKRVRSAGSRRTKVAIRRLARQELTPPQILEHLKLNRLAVKLGITLGAFLSA